MKKFLVAIVFLVAVSMTAAKLPVSVFWIPTAHATWESAVSEQVASHGKSVLIQTGDELTPYVSVRRVEGDFVLIPYTPYSLTATSNRAVAASVIGTEEWSRTGTYSDGTMLILTRR